MSKLQLVQFETTDKLLLPGLLYEPVRKTKAVAIFLHGISSSVFYQVDRTNELGTALTKAGVAYFSFNNRGAELIKPLRVEGKEDKVRFGMTYELIKDCIKDIDGAIKFLGQQGYQFFYLIGHSTGANKICVYNFYNPNSPIGKYVLLGGGDDTGLSYQALGKRRFTRLLLKAETQVKKGKGETLADEKLYDEDEIFSYQATYDILNPDGDYNTFPFLEHMRKLKLSKKPLFRHYKSIKKPTLVIYGTEDEYCYGDVSRCVDILKQETTTHDKFTFQTIKGADHSFHGKEKQLARVIAEWL